MRRASPGRLLRDWGGGRSLFSLIGLPDVQGSYKPLLLLIDLSFPEVFRTFATAGITVLDATLWKSPIAGIAGTGVRIGRLGQGGRPSPREVRRFPARPLGILTGPFQVIGIGVLCDASRL